MNCNDCKWHKICMERSRGYPCRDFKEVENMKCCRICTKRHIACHDHCEDYQQERAEYLDNKRKLREQDKIDKTIIGLNINRAKNISKHEKEIMYKGI